MLPTFKLFSQGRGYANAARAGVSISNFDKDFGIDGTFFANHHDRQSAVHQRVCPRFSA
ncbi:hypothetical protein [Chamaesiphon sp. VAR_48_metabat_403]|uniref:hypothetical protein n=1 Tax=Chamaesiphon sp. VAR_48_metabat_403 TaxID=2964700 RepID=UPI00286DBF1C|nr:hypothetical protein [Chamaesiphon sp. VAR_48_metabat_403]